MNKTGKLLLLFFIPFFVGWGPFTDCEDQTLCSLYDSFCTDATCDDAGQAIGAVEGEERTGTQITPDVSINICKVAFHARFFNGNINNLDFYCVIWSMTGTSLNARLGVSDEIDGENISNNTWLLWSFASAVALTGTVEYSVHVKAVADGAGPDADATFSGTNSLVLGIDNENDQGDMDGGLIAMDGVSKWTQETPPMTRELHDAEDDLLIRIYTQ